MSVKLRMMRMGKTKQPTYRLVAADERRARNGRFIEIIGTYQPRHEPSTIQIDNERAVHWLRHGAQPTETARKVLEISGAWAEFKGEPFTPKEPPAPKVVKQTPPKEPEPAAVVGEEPPDEAAEISDSPGAHEAAVDEPAEGGEES